MVVFIFLKHNGRYGRLADSSYFYTEESIPCTNFRVRVTPLRARYVHGHNRARNLWRPGCDINHLSNQIAVLFDQLDLWKESVGILDFSREDNHQGKMPSEVTTFGEVWSLLYLIQSDCRILCPSISLVKVNDGFLHGDSNQGKEDVRLPLLVGCCASCPVILQDSLIINISLRNELLPLCIVISFCFFCSIISLHLLSNLTWGKLFMTCYCLKYKLVFDFDFCYFTFQFSNISHMRII